MLDKKISPEDVASYLAGNPEFFHLFPNLLESLSIPHPDTGKSISLLERQVFMLREQKIHLQDEVDSLVSIAGDNVNLLQKVQLLAKNLLQAENADAAVQTIYEQMQSSFKVDLVNLYSWDVPSQSVAGLNQLGLSQSWVSTFKENLVPGKPVCGLLEADWSAGLFPKTKEVASICCLPLGWDKVWGVLALGSTTDRFQPDLGTYFLKIIAELISARLNRLFSSCR